MKPITKVRIFGIIVFLLSGGMLVNMILDVKKAIHTDKRANTIENIKEYADLFDSNVQDKLKVQVTCTTRTRNPVTLYSFYTSKIIVYKISSFFKKALNNIHIESSNEEDNSSGIVYDIVQDNRIEFKFKSGNPGDIDDVYMGYNAEGLKYLVKNDSSLNISFAMKNFYIKYGPDDKMDLFIMFDKSKIQNEIPVNVQLLKRNHSLYLLILYDYGYKPLKEEENLLSLLK